MRNEVDRRMTSGFYHYPIGEMSKLLSMPRLPSGSMTARVRSFRPGMRRTSTDVHGCGWELSAEG